MDWLWQVAREYGLFVALVCYVLWDSHQREKKLMDLVKMLSNEIKVDLTKIKERLWGAKD